MIVGFPAVLFLLGLLLVYGSAGMRRQIGTLAMVAAAAWALAFLIDPHGAAWGLGPGLATLMLPRPARRVPSSFEVLTRRTLTVVPLLVIGLILGLRLPVGENPVLLNAIPWLLGAVGAAWVLSPIDERERVQGQVLMVAATAAIISMAAPAGTATTVAAGAMAIIPVIAARQRATGHGPVLSSLMLGAAALLAALAAVRTAVPQQHLSDLTISVSGPVLVGVALVFAAAALGAAVGFEWSGLLAALVLVAVAPALRWPALAALIAVVTITERSGERPIWLALAALAAVPVVQALGTPAWSARVATVALAAGLVLVLYAARAGLLRVVVLPAAGFLVLLSVLSLTAGNLTRFQWIVAAGGLLLVLRALLAKLGKREARPTSITDALLMALLLLAISARDGLGLGAVAAVLLLADLAIVRIEAVAEPRWAPLRRLLTLSRSNWPPAITFTGATLAVIATLQASLAMGLLAALLFAALQLAPLIDYRSQGVLERPRTAWQWMTPLISLACGAAPALVLRMLRL